MSQPIQKSLLTPVEIKPNNNASSQPFPFSNPTSEIIFTQINMIQDLNHLHLQTNLCSNCCPATNHFIDSKPAIDKMIEQTVTFTWNKESLMVDPQPDLPIALFEPINVEVEPKISRPRGTISTQRFHTDIENRA